MNIDSPVHSESAPTTRWSRANFAEAIQGVQTPLGWSFWNHTMETSVRRAFGQMGVFGQQEVPPPTSPDARISTAFFGLPAGNVHTFHRIGEVMPGTSGNALVEQMFGEARETSADFPSSRSPVRSMMVGAKLPVAIVRSARNLKPIRADIGLWWRSSVIDAPPAGIDDATALLRTSAEQFIRVGSPHAAVSMIGQALAEMIETLAQDAWGSRADAANLMTGYGSMEETEVMADICAMSSSELEMPEFLARHGYHGPDEGDLTSTVWREDPRPVHRLVDLYKGADVAHPRTKEEAQLAKRAAAEERLLAALSPTARVRARLIFRLAKSLIPMRETGKAAVLHAIDGARCASGVLGRELATQGLISDPADVCFLTYEELLAGVSEPVKDLVDQRKADHARFEALHIPQSWTGNPVPVDAAPSDSQNPHPRAKAEVTGIGVVGEEVTGRARVALDPAEVDLDAGDILVCRTTDPSWTPLFLLADALVIDTGGAMSHGAIVARELGVPCVINTLTGTTDIPDGATITVNGSTGIVTIQEEPC